MNLEDDPKDHRGRYAERPSQIPWPGWKAILKRTFGTVSDADLSLRCAGVAFFSFLSIFPVLACFILVYGLVATRDTVRDQLFTLERFAPKAVFELVQERLEALLSQPEVGLGVGLLISFGLALWSGSRGTNSLIGTINLAYYQKDGRGFVTGALLSLGLTLGALGFLTMSLFTVAAIPALTENLPFARYLETIILWARWPALALMVYLAILVLYRLAPYREDAKWRWITPGALTAAVLWMLLSVLFSVYVEQFGNYSATFGSLSVAVVTMLWLYYSSMVIALGAALNAEIELQTKMDTTTGPQSPMGERGAYVADNLPEQ